MAQNWVGADWPCLPSVSPKETLCLEQLPPGNRVKRQGLRGQGTLTQECVRGYTVGGWGQLDMTLTSLKELPVRAPMMLSKNPQKCCRGERISLMPDCNRNNQVSPFSLLPFVLSLSRGDSESGIRSKSNNEAAMTPHLPADSSCIRPNLVGRGEFKLHDKFEFWIERDIFINWKIRLFVNSIGIARDFIQDQRTSIQLSIEKII